MNQKFADIPKTRAQQLVEIRAGIDLPDYLEDQYERRGRRLVDIAADLDIDTGTVSRWMAQFGIPRRIRTKVA